MLDRRRFQQRIVAATVAAHLPLRSTERARADQARRARGDGYFDIHTHFGRLTNYTPPLAVEELLRWMDAHDVSQAVVLPLVSPESTTFALTPEVVLTATKPYRDRLIPFCSFDPRTDYGGGDRGLLDILKRYVDEGAKGFGEHKTGLPIDDPRNMKLYAACNELKLPLLVHMDNARNSDRPGLPGLAKALAAFPDVAFIGHAFGWWSAISGDATQEEMGRSPRLAPVKPGGAIDALMDKYPNLYGDLSASAGAAAIRRDLKFGREFLIRRADRLLFGTDYHFPGQKIPQFELYDELDLPADVAAKIFRTNARRLLGW